jgi:subtilase family serine protease
VKSSQITRGLVLANGFAIFAFVVYAGPTGAPVPVITQSINAAELLTLGGNTRPEAVTANDLGAVPASFPMEHMLLQLKRSPAREAALVQYIAELSDKKSANYHQWLTPAQFAQYFGVATADVNVVTGWLKAQGLTVNGVQASGLMIDFSGTAGQVSNAFHTSIHNLNVNGASHFGNMSDPAIPAALAPVVGGIVSLHNFYPKPLLVPKPKKLPQYTFTNSFGSQSHALVPGDIATIYNFNPLFAAGITGKGQSIMVVEDTYLYSVDDWTIFRKTFGLTRPYPSGTLSQISPSGAFTCTNPGFQGVSTDPGYGDDGEAIIDVEWASAAAPNAAIILAACTDTSTFGGLIALENVLNGPAGSLPSVVSISYGEAEASNGAASNLAYNTAYQQAVTEGVSIFVSSGDEDAASADLGNVSTHGIGVSGFTSTPYNVSVGGLDFGYTADLVNFATYWSSTNSNTYTSALSYIQEIPWNNSCAGSLVANFLGPSGVGETTTSDPLDLCNSTVGSSFGLLDAVGGSGGPSGCATGTASTRGVVSGTCAGYPKPSWQSGLFGNPADGVRDIPDVALFASNGFWDAYYVVCWSNPDPNVGGGFTCTGPPSTWAGFGGTSVASPIMAGIQALVNQHTGSRWGNPDTVYYSLADTEYGASGSSTCNSNTVVKTGNSCIFYDVTQGDNVGACKAKTGVLTNCYRPTETPAITYGLLSTSNSSDQSAYSTGVGWDFPSGIGSVNAYNLVMNWP